MLFHSCRKWLATTSGFQQLLPQWKEDFLVERTYYIYLFIYFKFGGRLEIVFVESDVPNSKFKA